MAPSILDRVDPLPVMAVISLIAMAIRLFPVFLSRPQLVRFVADDGYMYFQIARNLAAGKGATFDGVTKTNGFHPLYPLLITPLFKLFAKDEDRAVRAAVAMLGMFNVATVAFIYLIVNWIAGPWPAVFASSVWLFNPWVLYVAIEGLEAPIWVFFAAAASALWLWMKLNGQADDLALTAALGCLMGMAFLARSEAILLLPAIAVDMVITLRGEGTGTVLAHLALFGGATAALYSPWLGWCWANFRRLTQVSGEILSHKHRTDIMERFSFRRLPKYLLIMAFNIAYSFDKFLRAATSDRLLTMALAAFAGGVLATGLVDLGALRGVSAIAFLGLFLAIHTLFYGGWLWRFQDWYFLSVSMVGAVFAGIAASVVAEVSVGNDVNGLIVAGAMALGAFAVVGAWMAMRDHRSIDGPQRSLLKAAEWTEKNTPQDATVACVNVGIMAFYSGRTVFNLSGAVNNPAAQAIHEHKLLDYVKRSGAQYFVDFESAIDYFARYWGEDPRKGHFEVIETLGGSFRGAPMRAWRVVRSDVGESPQLERAAASAGRQPDGARASARPLAVEGGHGEASR